MKGAAGMSRFVILGVGLSEGTVMVSEHDGAKTTPILDDRRESRSSADSAGASVRRAPCRELGEGKSLDEMRSVVNVFNH